MGGPRGTGAKKGNTPKKAVVWPFKPIGWGTPSNTGGIGGGREPQGGFAQKQVGGATGAP